MYYSYCTLFDKNYLDKGMAAVHSLKLKSCSCRIYVLCMDHTVYRILTESSSGQRIILIPLEDFLDDGLRRMRNERTCTEFSWSCSAFLISYVLEKYKEPYCTYIDADLFFYSDPDILVDELIESGKSVQIIEHRFRMNRAGRKMEKQSGRFCVEFNTFKNDSAGRMVLDDWKDCIRKQCSSDAEKGLGDQFYLNEWPDKFSCVHILENPGAGLAPWNMDRYQVSARKKELYVSMDGEGCYRLVFFHFHGLHYINEHTVNICIFGRFFHVDEETVFRIYIPYIKAIVKAAKEAGEITDRQKTAEAGEITDRRKTAHEFRADAKVIKDRFKRRNAADIWNGICWRLKELKNGGKDYIDINSLCRKSPDGSPKGVYAGWRNVRRG